MPGIVAETAAPKSIPWVRERAACTFPWPVHTAHSRSLASTESAMCGSPPANAALKLTPSPAGEPPRNGTTVNATAEGFPGAQARKVSPLRSVARGTRGVCSTLGANEIEPVGERSSPSGS